jgi:serine protease
MQALPCARWMPALLLALLAACGGGGGGSPSAAPPAESTPPPTPEPEPDPEPDPDPDALYRVSGHLRVSAGKTLDLTTNDPFTLGGDNNSPQQAQRLANPTTLGGYLNAAGEGSEGRSLEAGDVEDFYRVELFTGQSITLLVASPEAGDVDLYLYDAAGEIVDFSIETGDLEQVSVPADGSYIVNASLFSGATLYNLAIGSGATLQSARERYAAVIANEAIVEYASGMADDEDATSDAAGRRETRLDRRLGLQRVAGGRGRSGLFALQPGGNAAAQARDRLQRLRSRADAIAEPRLREVWQTLLRVKRLAREPGVSAAAPNYRVRALAAPNDEAYPLQWHYPLINLPAAWDITNGDPGVVVAVVDTGILSRHPDLAGQWVPGYDFVRDPERAGDGDGIDPDPEDTGSGNLRGDAHGTHVAGTVAAAGNNRIGVTGAAWGVRVMPLRALGLGGEGSSYDVLQAVRFAAGLANDSGRLPERPADIINLSLGGEGFSQLASGLYRDVRARGISVVAAAGNEASSEPGYPAAYADVFSVSAVDAQRNLAPYSNRGDSIDLAAPGGDGGSDITGDGYPDGVLSTGVADGSFAYTFSSGTSMAAPHVAAVFALMKSVNPDLTATDIASLLAAGALTDDDGNAGRDERYGVGIINARKAVEAALESLGNEVDAPTAISASTSVLNFGSRSSELEFVVSGTGGARVTSVLSDSPWLSLAAVDTNGAGFGRYVARVDRSTLAAGVYRASLSLRSTANTLRLDVLASVGDPGEGDLGNLYVLLYDPVTDSVAAQTVARANDAYRFELPPAPAGDYLLFAGTDLNNDLAICDPGEACGALLTLDQPLRLRLDRDHAGIDFPVEFQLVIPSGDRAAGGQSTAPRARPPVPAAGDPASPGSPQYRLRRAPLS